MFSGSGGAAPPFRLALQEVGDDPLAAFRDLGHGAGDQRRVRQAELVLSSVVGSCDIRLRLEPGLITPPPPAGGGRAGLVPAVTQAVTLPPASGSG